jgi:hypothetical protein
MTFDFEEKKKDLIQKNMLDQLGSRSFKSPKYVKMLQLHLRKFLHDHYEGDLEIETLCIDLFNGMIFGEAIHNQVKIYFDFELSELPHITWVLTGFEDSDNDIPSYEEAQKHVEAFAKYLGQAIDS